MRSKIQDDRDESIMRMMIWRPEEISQKISTHQLIDLPLLPSAVRRSRSGRGRQNTVLFLFSLPLIKTF